MNDRTLQVIFGTGPLGKNLAKILLAEGRSVLLISRSGRNPLEAHPLLSTAAIDATDRDAAIRACKGASVVYNCTNAPYHQWTELLSALFGSIREVARAVDARLIVADNLYAYGPVEGPMTEETPYLATGTKGRLRAKIVQETLEAHHRGELEVAIAQGSDFYGPDAENAFMGKRTFLPVRDGKLALVVGDPDVVHSYTYVPDFSRALSILGSATHGMGRVWHVPTAAATTPRAFIEEIAKQAGTRARIMSVSYGLLYTLGIFDPKMREIRENWYQLSRPYVLDSSAFEIAFGVAPTPVELGIRQTLEWLESESPRPLRRPERSTPNSSLL